MSDSSAPKIDRDSTALLLGVLSAVERDSRVTQRSMSSELGVALGLANAVLKRCVRKGLIKISTAPLNRYAYYLTPSGFREKARLTTEYLLASFDLFRKARSQYAEIFGRFAARGLKRVVLVGASELAEAALLSAREAYVDIVALVDAEKAGQTHLGFAIAGRLADVAAGFDAVVLCSMHEPQAAYSRALEYGAVLGFDDSRVVGPDLLRLRAATACDPNAGGAA